MTRGTDVLANNSKVQQLCSSTEHYPRTVVYVVGVFVELGQDMSKAIESARAVLDIASVTNGGVDDILHGLIKTYPIEPLL